MEELLFLLQQYGVDVLLKGVAITIVTGLIKMPLKALARRSKNSKSITRFIVFLPIIIGFGYLALRNYYLVGSINFNTEFCKEWLAIVSISLAFYSVWEKFIPSKNKILTEIELEKNKKAVALLWNLLVKAEEGERTAQVEDLTEESDNQNKIDLEELIEGLRKIVNMMETIPNDQKEEFVKEKVIDYINQNEIEIPLEEIEKLLAKEEE